MQFSKGYALVGSSNPTLGNIKRKVKRLLMPHKIFIRPEEQINVEVCTCMDEAIAHAVGSQPDFDHRLVLTNAVIEAMEQQMEQGVKLPSIDWSLVPDACPRFDGALFTLDDEPYGKWLVMQLADYENDLDEEIIVESGLHAPMPASLKDDSNIGCYLLRGDDASSLFPHVLVNPDGQWLTRIYNEDGDLDEEWIEWLWDLLNYDFPYYWCVPFKYMSLTDFICNMLVAPRINK